MRVCKKHPAYVTYCANCQKDDLVLRKEPIGPAGETLEDAGYRDDTDKPRVDLIPGDAMIEIAKVYTFGAKKYSDRNWEKGMHWSRMIGSLLRHTFKFMMGENIDEESGLLHSSMIAWNAIGLLTYQLRGIGEDDRHKL